jgi:signal transduction histidine kinase
MWRVLLPNGCLSDIVNRSRAPSWGYTELMTDGAYGEPSEKMLGILQRLEANGRHLLGLINDVLDLSKIEAGQLELSDYCIQDIAHTVRSTLEPLAADKKLTFKVEVAPQLPPGRGDGRRLTQVLINLVGNAIKFTDAGERPKRTMAHSMYRFAILALASPLPIRPSCFKSFSRLHHPAGRGPNCLCGGKSLASQQRLKVLTLAGR